MYNLCDITGSDWILDEEEEEEEGKSVSQSPKLTSASHTASGPVLEGTTID